MADQFPRFGNFWAGDGLWNIPVGGPSDFEVSFRFRAENDVAVNAIRYFNTWSKERPGYHAGSGGSVVVSLRTCNLIESGNSGVTIAAGYIDSPVERSPYPVLNFKGTVLLVAGCRYAIDFRNVHGSSKDNWCSVNTMAILSPGDRRPNNSTEVFVRNSSQPEWAPFKPHLRSVTPIFTLYNRVSPQLEDQVAFPGYGGMESWVAEPRRVAGDEQIRQVFIPVRDIDVKNVAIRIARTGKPGKLKALLTRGLIPLASATADGADVPLVDTQALPPNRVGHDWIVLPFPRPVTLTAADEHRITFTAPAGDAYEAFPLRDGSEFGFCSPWPKAWAEYTRTGPAGWRRWEAWGKPSNRGDLQVFFNA